jgi:hypothetical protein
MRYTIITDDKLAYKDTTALEVDVSVAPADVHALQFNSNTNKGWIEFKTDDFDHKKPNEPITELPSWAVAIFHNYDTVASLNTQPMTGDPETGR